MKEYKLLPLRILVLPIVFAMMFIFSMYKLIETIISFTLYGGEFIILCKNCDRKKISDVFDKVDELVNSMNMTKE